MTQIQDKDPDQLQIYSRFIKICPLLLLMLVQCWKRIQKHSFLDVTATYTDFSHENPSNGL